MPIALIVTLGAIVWWALLSAVSRVLMVNYNLDPWLFGFLQLCTGGIGLLLISGRGALDLRSFKRPSTWAISGFRVLSAAIYTVVLASVSVLEAGTLGGINIPVLAVMLWVISSKRPGALEWVGFAVILIAVFVMAFRLEAGVQLRVISLMLVNASCLAAMNLLAERHPENLSENFADRFRFTGAVLLITAILFVVVRLLQNGSFAGLGDPVLLLASTVVGVTLRAPAMVLAFWSIKLAGAQGYTAAIAILPLVGMMFEQIAYAVGLLDVSRFQLDILWLALAVLLGTGLTVVARLKRN